MSGKTLPPYLTAEEARRALGVARSALRAIRRLLTTAEPTEHLPTAARETALTLIKQGLGEP